eukprot:CAMPEP_0201580054 /NCGR_PEP_ID=MMETSP0190_2-20130828/33111_1 /ASSEMBLY_ACC=CAM_ASM_000263 /TAXON_ID=37353 /ORGANISM="Rosalina sp." /LENGTH=136 /DNA_ID=CAMNT_0048015405 /DNA_START=78 /DNA_END=489 /DNA_ORIENTATION=+
MGNETSTPNKKGKKKGKKKVSSKSGGKKKTTNGASKKKTTNGSTKSHTNGSSKGGMGAISEDAEDDGGGNTMGFGMDKKLTINDFTFLKVVGKGSFGKVMQVRKNDDGKIYALKVLKKKELVKRKQEYIPKQKDEF